MNSDGARVFLVLPTSRPSYRESGKHSIEWYARRALRMANALSPASGVDVFLYGNRSSGPPEPGGTAVRTRVDRSSLDEWAGDWAVAPNAGRGVLEDRRPASRLERVLAVGDASFSRPRTALRQVVSALAETTVPTLVIFRLDSPIDQEEILLAIRDTGADRSAFWQVFGWSHAIDGLFWTRGGLHRGRVLPNVRADTGGDWSHRSLLRRFSQWSRTVESGKGRP
ncbi:hypothetical protein [Streptomyces fradiae]|uniref:hypothetical protein n=1 Tax=Streptomyces fradiae TaxID=1906 RepID=UPI002942A0C8|nr:hypothetical protein [Streptomyces fradiae]WOI62971.1 hypothetical protein RYQ63_25480 [Streptomyces fradiae]